MEKVLKKKKKVFASTRNACKLCAPLGATLVFRGIEGCIPMIHGSQGCSTYIRRYMISHYKEPLDIASSNFSEETTIYGGNRNFNEGIGNIRKQYKPAVIGIASTCLAETIGEDVPHLIAEYKDIHKEEADLPEFVFASTPSYRGSHMDGFFETVASAVRTFAKPAEKKENHINIFSGFVSPADLRVLKDFFEYWGLDTVLFPDFSDTMDNPFWKDYHLVPEGGTPVKDIVRTGSAMASIELGVVLNKASVKGQMTRTRKIVTAGGWLEDTYDVPNSQIYMPVGIDATDAFVKELEKISGKKMPERFVRQRGRLIDSYIDCHKYVSGKRAMVYGEEDLVIGMVSFLHEIGVKPVIVGSGGKSSLMTEEVNKILSDQEEKPVILEDSDFEAMHEYATDLKPDFIIGHSKGYYIARELGIPIVRIGFPIHDRADGPRIKHLMYEGAQQLFDRIVNSLLQYKQDNSPVGYKYM